MKTRGVRINYRRLNDPFSEDKDADILQALMAETGDKFASLKEAKESPKWPEWDKGIVIELDTLQEKGTWELVDKPKDAVPLNNKWVFVRKRNREGIVQKYKARLVAKGYAECLGHDYNETHSPVIRLETIQAILAIATIKGLIIQQMDIKGAYLNGTLKETIYIKQPNGYKDGTKCICKLIKTLYGLKQSGRKWNAEFDSKMKKHGFRCLRSEPCAYTRSSPFGSTTYCSLQTQQRQWRKLNRTYAMNGKLLILVNQRKSLGSKLIKLMIRSVFPKNKAY